MAKKVQKEERSIEILPLNEETVAFKIRGIVPYVQNKFSQKAKNEMKEKQEGGSTKSKGKKKEAKDFKQVYEAAIHYAKEGWIGIPCSGLRAAMISACRLAGFKMTHAKLSLFVEPDGFDADDGTPLFKITKGKPKYVEHHVRLESGVADIRPRPMWDSGWEALVRIRYDADQFTLKDVANLLMRVGKQVGIGEGRPDGKKSCGMGWGLFESTN